MTDLHPMTKPHPSVIWSPLIAKRLAMLGGKSPRMSHHLLAVGISARAIACRRLREHARCGECGRRL